MFKPCKADGIKSLLSDKRKIRFYNNDAQKQTICVEKIEVYSENGGGSFLPFLAVWIKGKVAVRTPALDKEIVYYDEEGEEDV